MILKNQAFDETALVENEKLFNLAMLYEMDDNEYVAQIIGIFLKETSQELQMMKEAAEAKKANVVCSGAHKLKSSAGIIAANRLFTLLEEIEEISKAGNITNDLICKVEKARGEFKRLQPSLQLVLKGLQ